MSLNHRSWFGRMLNSCFSSTKKERGQSKVRIRYKIHWFPEKSASTSWTLISLLQCFVTIYCQQLHLWHRQLCEMGLKGSPDSLQYKHQRSVSRHTSVRLYIRNVEQRMQVGIWYPGRYLVLFTMQPGCLERFCNLQKALIKRTSHMLTKQSTVAFLTSAMGEQ